VSFKRNVNEDRAATRRVLTGQPRTTDGKVNWLGHRVNKKTHSLDEMLIAGATKSELEAVRGAIDEHLYHLRVEHGLSVAEEDGVLMFDRAALGMCDDRRGL
jgi:hypothetical protein